jgi:hypothetical protein
VFCRLSRVAARKQPKTLLEWNLLLAAGTLLSPEQLATGKRLPVMDQARVTLKAMPKATRVGEFVALWTITKYQDGETNVERLAEVWNEPVRTMYRRLEEFREVWAPAGFETPDKLADGLIADYRQRDERLKASFIGRLLSAPISPPMAVSDLPLA